MSETFDKVVWVVAAVILIPVALSPAGWLFAAVLAIAWLAVAYGGRYVLGVEKMRRSGERSAIHRVRNEEDR